MTTKIVPAGQVFYWGALTATSGQYLYPGTLNNAASTASESSTRIILPRPGVLRRLYALCGADATVTVRIDFGSTALAVTLTANVTNVNLTDEIQVTAPANLTVLVGGTAGSAIFVSCEYV